MGVRLPNWRKAADYSFPEAFSPNRWAWEFLRRNPDYQVDWTAALSRFLSVVGEFEGWTEGARSDDPEDPEFYLLVGEKDRWHLAALLNPATDEPNRLGFQLDFGTVRILKEGKALKSRGQAYPLAEFNLHLPLVPQLEAVERKLRLAQERLKIRPRRVKNYRRLWAQYLRLLDADLVDGRTAKQIASALRSEEHGLDEKKVWDRLQAARKMMLPEGYLSILLTTP